jgi:hypothetical protein
MALTSTVHQFLIDLADADRGVYESLQLRVARHASESEEFLVARVLAYCLEYQDGISFSKGLCEPEVIIVAKKKGKGGKQQDYLIITIKDALVTSYQTAGGEGDKPSVEEISFVFHTIQLTHPPTGKQVTDSPLGARP